MSPDHSHKIEELPPDQRNLAGAKYRRALYFITQTSIWTTYLYFTVRSFFILTTPEPTWKIWTMFIIEGLFARMLHQHRSLSLAATSSPQYTPRKKLRLRNDSNLPKVDILITCCGESLDIILDTVRAACVLDYPTSRYRVRLLDDGASTELRDAASTLSLTWHHLTYHTRGKQSGQSFAKAGNLNYALFSLQTEDPPEFCTVVDADSILLPEFLRATLPHLIEDPQAALLTTRQYFYNLPRGDPLSQSRAYFYTCENTELDLLGHALDAGSGAVFRRQAILDVGGYPTFSFSEDWQLSLILRGMGKRTIQVQEALQFGLVPTSVAGHIKQRNRWNIGHSQQVSLLFPSTSKSIPDHLRWDIAIGGLSIMSSLATYVIGFVAVPLLLALEGNVIPNQSTIDVKVQIILATANVASTWAYHWLRSAHAGVPFVPLAHTENSWLAAAHIYAVIRFHLIGSQPKGSFVTGSTRNSTGNPSSKAFSQKAYMKVLESGIWLNICLLVASLGGMILAIQMVVRADGPLISTVSSLAAWPPLLYLFLLVVANNWVPVGYIFSPPVYHSRASRLVTTEKGISYSREGNEEICEPSLMGRLCTFGVPMVLIGVLVGSLV